MTTQGFGLRRRDVEFLDAAQQQVVNLVHHVRNRGVRTNQCALHATGAQLWLELGHGAPEQPLVFGTGTARRHEQARAWQHRCLAQGAFTERFEHHVVVVFGVEHASAARWTRALALRG